MSACTVSPTLVEDMGLCCSQHGCHTKLVLPSASLTPKFHRAYMEAGLDGHLGLCMVAEESKFRNSNLFLRNCKLTCPNFALAREISLWYRTACCYTSILRRSSRTIAAPAHKKCQRPRRIVSPYTTSQGACNLKVTMKSKIRWTLALKFI